MDRILMACGCVSPCYQAPACLKGSLPSSIMRSNRIGYDVTSVILVDMLENNKDSSK